MHLLSSVVRARAIGEMSVQAVARRSVNLAGIRYAYSIVLAQVDISIPEPSTINSWLIAVAVLGAVALIAHIIPVFQRKCGFDLNKVVPMFLECGGVVASVKMMVLAFRIGNVVQNNPIEEIFDAASVLIGGGVFFCASAYALLNNIVAGYTTGSRVDAPSGNGEQKQ